MATSLPKGYHSITPSIIVRDAARAIDFYKEAFGAEELNRMAGPDGSIMHAEIKIGDSILMLGEENEQWGTKSPLLTNGNPSSLHIYVENADASFDRAIKAGAKVRYPLEDAFWGELVARLAERDLRAELGATKLSEELTDEETEKLSALEDNYWREFEASGVDHVVVLRGGKG